MVGKIQKITPEEQHFPDRLRRLPDPPKQLFIIGSLSALDGPTLSVVGSRKVSAYGRWATLSLTESVAEQGVAIISGLAYGVDSIAHRAALDAGSKTIAVLAHGLDQIYPASHRELAVQIVEQGGALVSEYEQGIEPLRHNFIARNRIVSGLGDGVLITEATSKSGTLHTANFALEQGRTVMAVPGNINSLSSEGTNRLLQNGASTITKPDDILFELGIDGGDSQQEIFGNSPEETKLLKLIKSGITDSSELLDKSELDTPIFNQTLTTLEISGKIHPTGSGHWSLR